MATVFMRWLETKPEDYERGIQLLTLGQLGHLHARLVDLLVHKGARVLEIGCGTGALAMAMARRGARVTAIDISKGMLSRLVQALHLNASGNMDVVVYTVGAKENAILVFHQELTAATRAFP